MRSSQLELFRSLNLMLKKFRYSIKINTNVLYLNTLEDCLKILKENESLFETYRLLLQEQQNTFSSNKKVKRSPYKHIIAAKSGRLSTLNNKCFQQITFILKEMLFFSLFQSVDFNAHMLWNLEVVGVYNKWIETVNMLPANCLNSSSCSNNFPNLLLPQTPLHLGVIFTLVFNQHIEENILDILYRVLNVNVIRKLNTETDSTSSSLEVLKVLTNNIISDNVNLWGCNFDMNNSTMNPQNWISENGKFVCSNSMTPFLQNYNACLSKFLSDYRHKISPSFVGNKYELEKLNTEVNNGLRIVWAYISSILDHAMLWWIDTPMCSYSLSFVDIIRSWILLDGLTDTQEPISSCLKALCEILTTYISNNAWDSIFRFALVKSTYSRNAFNDFDCVDKHFLNVTNSYKVWVLLFNHLRKSNNNILLISESFTRQAAVAEQIPILHRIDHSLHTMRIWATEQSKLQSSKWVLDVLFQVLNTDVKECLQIVSMLDFKKIEVDLKEILMTVCIYLRAKLILEIKANIFKLGNTKDECIKVLSSVCQTFTLAHFSLCFPHRNYWQRDYVSKTENGYVSFILDEIFLPALQSTKDIAIQELILKLICEAWIDYIYSQQIKFTECGALTLLNDFDEVQKWIERVDFLSADEIKRLCNHEVLHMCKGVGKVLVRKPKEIISIVHTPKHIESSSEHSTQESRLPSEMFVSNQSHWLQLRITTGKFSIFKTK